MGKTNGKPEVEPKLDSGHELTAGENEPDIVEEAAPAAAPEAGRDEELRRLKQEREELYDRQARMQAEFDNARKRASKEQAEFREYAAAEAIKPLLPILDSLERALATAPARDEMRAGVELIYKQMLDALAKMGLRPIPAVGEPFDPHLHQAVQMVDTTEAPDHQVLEELQRGYKWKDRLLRPAMVRVAHNPKK
jgi:molecular chaperone GrpE